MSAQDARVLDSAGTHAWLGQFAVCSGPMAGLVPPLSREAVSRVTDDQPRGMGAPGISG